MKEKVLYENQFFEFIEQEKEFLVDNEKKNLLLRFVRRSPGVRALIVNHQDQILLSYEYRYDLECFDYRLPGGKVFDSLKEYRKSLQENNILENATKAVMKEVKEEVGLKIEKPELLWISKAGTSVHWDLYYYIVKDYRILKNQSLEENEVINGFVWKSFEEVKEMCINHVIHEERTVGVLLSYILKNE